jgi:hypothetical protein
MAIRRSVAVPNLHPILPIQRIYQLPRERRSASAERERNDDCGITHRYILRWHGVMGPEEDRPPNDMLKTMGYDSPVEQ